MFRIPNGWTTSGEGAPTLQHSSGAQIWSWTNREPIVYVKELAAQRWTQLDGYVHDRDEQLELLQTEAGETACLIGSRGHCAGLPAIAILGFVVLSDGIEVVGGVAPADHGGLLRAAMRELVASFASTASSTRRFLYAPPPGWHGQAQADATVWYAPSFPRMRASLAVSPAERRPPQGVPHHVFDAIVAADRSRGFECQQADGPETIASSFGLVGSAWSVVGIPSGMARVCRDIVVLADELHVYTFVLATLGPADRQACLPVLREVVRSARPATQVGELAVV